MTAYGPRGGEYKNLDQKRMEEIWRTQAWKDRRNALLTEHQRCQFCNGKSGVINHRRQGYYEGYELCKFEEVDIICQPCHLHWTKTGGQKRSRMYDDCDSCEAPVFVGRKKCFNCGSKTIISKSYKSPETQAQMLRVLASCPEVRVGDRWIKIWSWGEAELEVTGFEKQDLPWPLVKTTLGTVGLPAFKFGSRLSEGSGISNQELEA